MVPAPAVAYSGTMARRTGSADLPLHGGRVPAWLAGRMTRIGRVLIEAIVLEFGREEVLRRLAHPFWFQSLGAAMGMDWHSSGITTSVLGALQRGLEPVRDELGLYVCGGRGRHSRKTPAELVAVGEKTGFDGESMATTSRLVAKVDSAAVQDGFELYLHGFVVDANGDWAVVQQGMDGRRRQARRYHWLSEDLGSFVDEPHAAIDGPNRGEIVNLTDTRARQSREAQLELVGRGPDRVVAELRRMLSRSGADAHERSAPRASQESSASPAPGQLDLFAPFPPTGESLSMPARHAVSASDVRIDRLRAGLTAAAERGPVDFSELLLTPGVGARTVEALALVSEVIYGTPCRFADPARFSMAHGGKDGHPFPVPLDVYDRTITTLRRAVDTAKLGNRDRLAAIRRLDAQARTVEASVESDELVRHLPRTVEEHIAAERRVSTDHGGRTVGT